MVNIGNHEGRLAAAGAATLDGVFEQGGPANAKKWFWSVMARGWPQARARSAREDDGARPELRKAASAF